MKLLVFLLLPLPGSFDVPPVRLPDVIPMPVPVPSPAAPMPLAANQLFVIDADVSCIVLASPAGLLTLTADQGPIKIRGNFIDGHPGVTETRTYKGKFVYTIEATGTGRCELLIVPASALQASEVLRRTLDVGSSPSPPPPPPPPLPPNDPFQMALQAAFIADKSKDAPLLAALYKQAADLIVKDLTLKTYGDLFTVLKRAQDTVVQPATIPKVRTVIGAELTKAFGSSGTAPIDHVLAYSTFARIAVALEAVK